MASCYTGGSTEHRPEGREPRQEPVRSSRGRRLTSVTYPGPTTHDYTYNAADRLTGVEGTSYTFDDNGNLTDRGSDDFVWDAEDRLTSATVSSTTTTFAYNGDGLRDSLTTGGNTTTFTWDIAAPISQVLDDGTLRYVYGLGRIAQVENDDTTHYFLSDGLGSVMALTESDGDVENTYEYDVFGAVRSSTGSEPNVFKFTGEQIDSTTGLEYLRARYYEQGTGRFLGLDPMDADQMWPGTLNEFSNVLNNPTNFADPFGLRVCKIDVKTWEDFAKCWKIIFNQVKSKATKLTGAFEVAMDEAQQAVEDAISHSVNAVDDFATTSCGDALLGGVETALSLSPATRSLALSISVFNIGRDVIDKSRRGTGAGYDTLGLLGNLWASFGDVITKPIVHGGPPGKFGGSFISTITSAVSTTYNIAACTRLLR